jgi:ankyrin repeat protein
MATWSRRGEPRRAAVNAMAIDGWTPLHGASRIGRLEIVRDLLVPGAAVDAATVSGATLPVRLPASTATRTWSTYQIVQELIDRGADVNAADARAGRTPLLIACHGGVPNCSRAACAPRRRERGA